MAVVRVDSLRVGDTFHFFNRRIRRVVTSIDVSTRECRVRLACRGVDKNGLLRQPVEVTLSNCSLVVKLN